MERHCECGLVGPDHLRMGVTALRCTLLGLLLALAFASPAIAQPYAAGPTNQSSLALIAPTAPTAANNNQIATTNWVNNFFATGMPLANGKIFIGSVGNVATAQTMAGDCTLVASGTITCTQAAGNFNVIGNLSVGGSIIDGNGILATNIVAPATPAAGTTRIYVDSTTKTLSSKNDAGTVSNTVVASLAVANQFMTGISAAGVITRAQPAVTNISGFGTGVAAALAINVGSAGAPVLFNGAAGTPSSATLTSATGLPISTGLTGAGTGILTALGVNVGTAGSVVVNGGALGTPTSGVATNLTGTAAGLTAGGLTGARTTLPTIQRFTSGSGTYTTPANVLWIEIEGVGPGGGGGAATTNNGAAGVSATCWALSGAACTTPVLVANSGAGGSTGGGGVLGGAASGGNVYNVTGGDSFAFSLLAAAQAVGGNGGNSCRGGGARGGVAGGSSAAANTGGGGGGGGQATAVGGAGGAAGGCFKHVINSPAATYTYNVGPGGIGGAAGVAAGGNGGSGEIDVIEHYN